ncbi:hypothetical protein FA002_02115 [Priestia megaterium]|uniref:hypothetical protein n=1 Tax=Priestia megaterium TaxID=1404 RepID=UPI0010AD3FEC|nr:hypothetical protein [Priestia megaterium]TJZ40387.1 hypothetical protein FA002_02115 [Priestia megaterium]
MADRITEDMIGNGKGLPFVTKEQLNEIEQAVDDIVNGGIGSNEEIVESRIDVKGEQSETLKERLDKDQSLLLETKEKTGSWVDAYTMGAKGGDKTKDDAIGIKAAIAMAQTLERKKVVIPGGAYYVGSTIVIPERMHLEMNKDTVLIPTQNVNVIQLKPQSSLQSGIIDTRRYEGRTFTDFTKACIYLDGNDIFSLYNELHQINGVMLLGEDHYYTDQKWTGIGIHMYSGKGSNGNPSFISFVNCSQLGIFNFEKGIFLDVDETIQSNDEWAWVTGCTFNQINMMNCTDSIYLKGDRTIPRDVGGNIFTNMQIQIEPNSNHAIYCEGSFNRFEGLFWDLHKNPKPSIEFAKTSRFNVVTCTHGYESPQHFKDDGYSNTISSSTNHVPDKRNLAYPLSIPFSPSFLGNQDDFIVNGDARGYTITQTSDHPIKNGMALETLLTFDTEVGVVWDGTNATYENPIVIELDASTDPIWYCQFIGYITAFKNFPRGCEIQVYDDLEKEWFWAHGIDNNSSFPFVVSAPWAGGGKVTKIQYKFWGSNSEQNDIEVGRIFAMSSKGESRAFMPRAGGKMYGDLSFNFFGGLEFDDGTGKKHKFTVENKSGLLVNRNVRMRNYVPAMRNVFNRMTQPFAPFFNGNQDDYLANGHLRGYTVTASPAPTGILNDLFTMDMETGVTFDATNVTAEAPITITINLASDEVPYMSFVGIFSPDKNSPKNVIIEVYDRSSSSWIEFHNETDITENFTVSADWNTAAFGRQIRIKMWGTNGTTNKISLSRVVAQSTKLPGNAFLPKSGGTVDGPLTAKGGLTIETRTSDPASPNIGQIWLRSDL